MSNTATPRRQLSSYQLFMLALSIWALLSLGVSSSLQLGPDALTVLDFADTFVCGLFFLDFLANLYWAPKRWAYFVTWGWLDLLSSVPTVDVLRWGRAARVLRILRVLRAVKSLRVLGSLVAAERTQSTFLAAVLMTLVLLVFSSLAMLQFEQGGGGSIQNAEDAMWWAVSTMTTVGYGDVHPVTSEGRLIASFLMVAGIGVFGTFSGLMASWFLAPRRADIESELAGMKAQLADIQRRLPADDSSRGGQ